MGITRHIMRFFGRERELAQAPEKPVSRSMEVPYVAGLPKGSETVLVAEDEKLIRENMVFALRRLGYKVIEAVDGEEALQIFHGTKAEGRGIDLLLTDLVMPRMSGKELAYRVGSLYPKTKVVFASAYPEKLSVNSDVFDQRIPFLQKPVSTSALAYKVREVLDAAKRERQYATREDEHHSVAE